MFVPVACAQCGKPFQVPEDVVGKATACPWCQGTVLALPVGTPVASPSPPKPQLAAPVVQEEPLPLDDEPTRPATARRPLIPMWAIPLAILGLLVALGVTIGVLRYKQGYLVSREWRLYTPPDGTCSVELLGKPTEDMTTESGERRYQSEGWYSGTKTWVGWHELNQVQRQLAATKDAWQHLTPIFIKERERLKEKHNGTVVKDATVKFDEPLTHEFRFTTPQGLLIERVVVQGTGANPRTYYIGILGKNLDPDGEAVKRLFDSFRVNE